MKIRKYGNQMEAFALIVGTVIGLGVFAIPNAARNVGIMPTVVLIILITLVMVLLSVLLAEIIIFDKREECIISYTKRYLGKWVKRVEMFSIFFGYTGSLLAYVLAVSVFVRAVLPGDTNYFWPIILFFTAVTCIILSDGIKNLGRIEFILSGIMCLAFIYVFVASKSYWMEVPNNWGNMVLPYGVIWFALTGESAIPIAVKILGGEKRKIFKIIWLAYVFIALVTILFFIGALKTGGIKIGPDPFVAMGQKMGVWLKYAGSGIGLFAIVTSHWVLSAYLKRILILDIKINPLLSWFLVVFIPLIMILLGASNFVHIIGWVGVVAGTTDALIILAIYKKIFSRKNTKPRVLPFKIPGYVIWVVFLLLLGAALSSVLTSL